MYTITWKSLVIISIVLLSTFPIAEADEMYQPGTPILNTDKPTTYTDKSYSPDPTADIVWSAGCGTYGVADIECAFNHARTTENTQLGTTLPMLSMPAQSTWDDMNDGEKTLWLINRERLDRGIAALHSIENNVTNVAQYYAQYLLNNNVFGHYEDGNDPWQRLDNNPAIGSCHDFLAVAENLAVFWTSGSSIALPLERSIYLWMYDDGICCTWGHRHAILWYPYNDNSGTAGVEGFLGIGRASGPHNGWNFGEIIVMNIFDPCSTWVYPTLQEKTKGFLPAVYHLMNQ